MTGGSPNRLSLSRKSRLKQKRDFTRLRMEGERLTHGCLVANWQRLSSDSSSKLGVITSGKIGNAVVRSRARRLLREAFRLHQHELSEPVNLVLVARKSLAGKRFAQVETDFLQTMQRAGLLKHRGQAR
jgi:ribonuclease P protein component